MHLIIVNRPFIAMNRAKKVISLVVLLKLNLLRRESPSLIVKSRTKIAVKPLVEEKQTPQNACKASVQLLLIQILPERPIIEPINIELVCSLNPWRLENLKRKTNQSYLAA